MVRWHLKLLAGFDLDKITPKFGGGISAAMPYFEAGLKKALYEKLPKTWASGIAL